MKITNLKTTSTDSPGRRQRGLLPPTGEAAQVVKLISVLGKTKRHFRAGTRLTFEGDDFDSVMCVLNGWVAMSKSLPDGQTQIIDFALPGDIASPVGADGKSAAVQVEAVTDAEVAILSEKAWADMLQSLPELQRLTNHLTAAARARISERMLRLGRGNAPMRVAYVLLELAVRLQSAHVAEQQCFHIPLTQQRLGEFAGLSSVHVCRTLRRLVRHDIISTRDHMDIRIKDIKALSEVAGVDIEQLRKEIEPRAA